MNAYPPGPTDGRLGLTFHRQFRDDPLGFATKVAEEYGDFAFVRIGWVRIYFINRPELIRDVLVSKVRNFHKLTRQMRALRKLEGDGLVVAEDPIWGRHRPVVQGSFHHRHFARYADIVVQCTRERLDQWPQNKPFDLAEDANELALQIMARIVFGVDLSDQARVLRDAVHEFRVQMMREAGSPVVPPDWMPFPGRARQRKAIQQIDQLLWQLIRDRQAKGPDEADMLSQILRAVTDRADLGVTTREVRDEAATLFVAGHDSTSASLAWFGYCLAMHPEIQEKVLTEIDALGGKTLEFADFPRLKYLEMVVKESMRLYPATGFLYAREPKEDIEVGGYTLKRGSWVFISPYIVQRNPKYFPDPMTFDPERFAPGREDESAPYTYLNFGAGTRICVGKNLANMEVTLAAATILQRFRLKLAQGPVQPEVEIFLRPKGGLKMVAVPREEVHGRAPLLERQSG